LVGLLLTGQSNDITGNGLEPAFWILGIIFALISAWALPGPRKPRFTITETGISVKGVLLPWNNIADYNVYEVPLSPIEFTTLELVYVPGYIPPKINLSALLGSSVNTVDKNSKDEKPKSAAFDKPGSDPVPQFRTRLSFYTGAKNISGDDLCFYAGEFFTGFRARADLARWQARRRHAAQI
jgi:hypothetical protein